MTGPVTSMEEAFRKRNAARDEGRWDVVAYWNGYIDGVHEANRRRVVASDVLMRPVEEDAG